MEDDNIVRFILVLGCAVVFPVGAYHRLKAHLASREKLDRRAEGLFILTTLRPMAVIGMMGYAGLRVGELVWLRPIDVDLMKATLRIETVEVEMTR